MNDNPVKVSVLSPDPKAYHVFIYDLFSLGLIWLLAPLLTVMCYKEHFGRVSFSQMYGQSEVAHVDH